MLSFASLSFIAHHLMLNNICYYILQGGPKRAILIAYNACIYDDIEKGIPCAKMFSSLSGVGTLLWISPSLNILCISSENHTALKMSIDLRMTFSYRHFRKIHFSGGGIPIGGSPSKTIEFLMTWCCITGE